MSDAFLCVSGLEETDPALGTANGYKGLVTRLDLWRFHSDGTFDVVPDELMASFKTVVSGFAPSGIASWQFDSEAALAAAEKKNELLNAELAQRRQKELDDAFRRAVEERKKALQEAGRRKEAVPVKK